MDIISDTINSVLSNRKYVMGIVILVIILIVLYYYGYFSWSKNKEKLVKSSKKVDINKDDISDEIDGLIEKIKLKQQKNESGRQKTKNNMTAQTNKMRNARPQHMPSPKEDEYEETLEPDDFM
jgi:hypothetical protein